MAVEILVPVALFATIIAIVWLISLFSSIKRREMHETLRASIEKGIELSPDIVESIFVTPDARTRDLRRGWIWLAIGLAFIFISFRVGHYDDEPAVIISSFATLPTFIGLAFLGFGLFGYGRKAS